MVQLGGHCIHFLSRCWIRWWLNDSCGGISLLECLKATTRKYKKISFLQLDWPAMVSFSSLFSLPGLTLYSFPTLLGPKVAYCHLPLPGCQSSNSNTLALSAQWTSFSHAPTHTIWHTKGAFGAFISFSLMAFSRLAYTWALICQIVRQNLFMCVFLRIYSLRDCDLSWKAH